MKGPGPHRNTTREAKSGTAARTPAGVMRPKAAHMQQLQQRQLNGHGAGVTKECGRQGSHRHPQPLTHFSNKSWIKGEQHSVVGFSF